MIILKVLESRISFNLFNWLSDNEFKYLRIVSWIYYSLFAAKISEKRKKTLKRRISTDRSLSIFSALTSNMWYLLVSIALGCSSAVLKYQVHLSLQKKHDILFQNKWTWTSFMFYANVSSSICIYSLYTPVCTWKCFYL